MAGIGAAHVQARRLEQGRVGEFDVRRRPARMTLAAAGEIGPGRDRDDPAHIGKPRSRAARSVAKARPPPAESPATTVLAGSAPCVSSHS